MGKRTFDVIGGSFLVVLTAPLVLACALVSAATYRAWPFFVQDRVGLHQQPFRLPKIRTLAPGTPTSLDKYEVRALRQTRCCGFLRGHHLDELPQLLSVVAGSMSLVGPRPEMSELAEQLPRSFAGVRAQVKPGLTGLWQISRAGEGLIIEDPVWDRHYVSFRTARLDAWILGRTVAQLLWRAPIESLADIPAWTGAAVAVGDQPVEPAAA